MSDLTRLTKYERGLRDEPHPQTEDVNGLLATIDALRARHEKLREGLRNLPRWTAGTIGTAYAGMFTLLPDAASDAGYLLKSDVDALLEDE